MVIRDAGPVARLTRYIQGFLDRPVVDSTGLGGNFAWEIVFSLSPFDPDRPSAFTALREQLGLALEPGTGQFDVHVVDAVREPTPN